MNLITAERVRELLAYDPKTGMFTWRFNRGNHVKAGDIAGSIWTKGNYRQIKIDGRVYQSHRIAWLYQTGEWPKAEIDHRNGNRLDNSFNNLREATHVENGQNRQRANADNKSTGELGVYWHKQTGKYRAHIKVNGVNKHLGLFQTVEAAVAARIAAEEMYYPFSTRTAKPARQVSAAAAGL